MNIPIRGDTRLAVLFGWPVAHSISPQIHNRAFAALNLPYAYVPLAVPVNALHNAVFALRTLGMAGANVTIPHKERVVNYCDCISELSAKTLTVNTLYFRDNLLCGTTTDPEGFLRALHWMGVSAEGKQVTILGNGGTARTLACALALDRIPGALTIAGRNGDKAANLARQIAAATGFAAESCTLDSTAAAQVMRRTELLVNCTSAGLYPDTDVSPLSESLLHGGMIVFDTIYNPLETKLLAQARARGCLVQNGLRMLLYQAIASSKLWTGVEPPEDIFDLEALQAQIVKKH